MRCSRKSNACDVPTYPSSGHEQDVPRIINDESAQEDAVVRRKRPRIMETISDRSGGSIIIKKQEEIKL